MDLKNMSWTSYLRKDGSKGIRNKILVIYTVECSSFVAKKIVQLSHDNDIEVVGFHGCTDNDYAVRLIISLIRHCNVGGVLVVGLGCEYIQPQKLAEIAKNEGKCADWFYIQEEGGTQKSIDKGLAIVSEMKKSLEQTPTATMNFSDLVIGAECGGSDYTSGLAGNVLVGKFFDRLVDSGGTAIFEEIVEAIGLVDILKNRAVDKNAEVQIESTYNKAIDYCRSVRQYSVSPGNFAGGLSTIEEKSMGAIIKSGSKKIQGILKVAEKPHKNGLWLLDSTPDPHWMQHGITNPNDNEGIIDLISAGCHIVFLVTGRGNVVGSVVSPVIKITGNHETYKNLVNDMDFDASPLLFGEVSQDALCESLVQYTIEIAKGNLTNAEIIGHKEYCIPYKYQEKTCKSCK